MNCVAASLFAPQKAKSLWVGFMHDPPSGSTCHLEAAEGLK